MLDLRTGDPILEDGEFVELENDYGFYQIIDNLLNCQLGSEPFNPFYGFDLTTAIRMSSEGSSPMFIEALLADALDSNKEKLISNVESIQAERYDDYIQAEVSVRSIFGQVATATTTVGGT